MRPHDVLGALLLAALLSVAPASLAAAPAPDAPPAPDGGTAPATTAPPTGTAAPTTGTAAPATGTAAPPTGTAAAGGEATLVLHGAEAPPPTSDPVADLAALKRPPPATFHVMASVFFGDGFRFNNPYRLRTQLGESAKTVSVTAPYVDLGVALAIGSAFGIQHGAALNLSVGLAGVAQSALAPSYIGVYRGDSARWMGFGRIGPAILLSPDANVGLEIGAGGAAFVTAKLAVTAEVVGDLFYGAATRETGFPAYPILSLQLGLLFDHEVLP
jgi:hypothetical protein